MNRKINWLLCKRIFNNVIFVKTRTIFLEVPVYSMYSIENFGFVLLFNLLPINPVGFIKIYYSANEYQSILIVTSHRWGIVVLIANYTHRKLY